MKILLISIMFIVISCLISIHFGKLFGYEKKQVYVSVISVVVISNLLTLLLHVVIGKEWSNYECTLLQVILSCVLGGIILPILLRKPIRMGEIMRVVCYLAIAVALYSTLTYGQIRMHSDTATAVALLEAQKESKSFFPDNWCYVNDELWILGMNFWTLPFYVILKSMVRARVLGTALVLVVTIGIVIFHSKKYWKDNSWIVSIPIILLCLREGTDFLDETFLNSVADNILYQGAYISQLIWLLLSTLLGYWFFTKKGKVKVFAGLSYSVLTILLCMGGIRQLAECVIPILGAVLIQFYIENKESVPDGKLFRKAGAILASCLFFIVPALIGEVIYKYLISKHYLSTLVRSPQFADSVKECWNNSVLAFTNCYRAFGYSPNVELFSIQGVRNALSAIVCTLIIFIIPILQMKKISKESKEVKGFYTFSALHNLIMLLMVIWCGYTTPRYLLSSFFLCIVISSRYIWKYWLNEWNLQSLCWGTMISATTIVMGGFILVLSRGWTHSLQTKLEFIQVLELCGTTKGYATYWNAYNNDVYSDMTLDISAVNISASNIEPYKWLVDSGKFCEDSPNSFLMLTEEENAIIEEQLESICGTPINYFLVEGMHVYVYDHDIMKYKNGALDGVLYPLEMRVNESCNVDEVTVQVCKEGIVTCPALDMIPGDYIVEVRGENLDAAEYNVYSYLNEDLSWEEISRTDDTIQVYVHNSYRGADIKVDIVNHTDQVVTVNYMTIKEDGE